MKMNLRDKIALMAAEVLLEQWPAEKILTLDGTQYLSKTAYQFADCMIEAAYPIPEKKNYEGG